MFFGGAGAGGKFTEDCTVSLNCLIELAVLAGIDLIYAGTDNGEGGALHGQGTPVGLGIDPGGHTRDNRHPCCSQLGG